MAAVIVENVIEEVTSRTLNTYLLTLKLPYLLYRIK